MVAAELLKSKGVDSVQASCLEVLEDMLIRYMRELSRQSKLNAEVARRASVNPVDVVLALQVQGVRWQDLEQYKQSAPDVDFAQGVSEFPVHKKVNRVQTFGEMGTSLEGTGRHVSLATKIPEFFPAFPDVHSFVETKEYERGDKNVSAQMNKIVGQKEAIGEALVKLHERTKTGEAGEAGGDGEAREPTADGADDTNKDIHEANGGMEVADGDQGRPHAMAMEVDAVTGDAGKDQAAEENKDAVAGDDNDKNKNAQNEEMDNMDDKDEDKAKDKTTLNPFLMPVKWEDKRENATADIVRLLRIEKEARLDMEKKRARDASVANVGADIQSSDVSQPNTVRTPVEFSGFTWIEGGHDQRRSLAKSGAKAPGVYDSGQGEHIQDKMQVEQLLARNQGHEGERDIAMDAEEL